MLSIVIPTYNSQNTITRCIKSILKIHKINYEVLLIDDGSKDKTKAIIEQFSNKFQNIHVFIHSHKGTSFGRNIGIKESKGNIICFIDSDDYINANKLEQIIINYYTQNTDLIITNLRINHRKLSNINSYSTNIRNFIHKNYPIYGHELIHTIGNKIYNNNVIKSHHLYFPNFQGMGEDLVFNLNFLLHSSKLIKYINIIYYNYLINKKSTTNTFEKDPLNNRLIIIRYINYISNKFDIRNNKILNDLSIKIIYSSLLNIFKNGAPKNRFNYIISTIKLSYKKNLILNKYKNYSLEYKILLFIIKTHSPLFQYITLILINMLRKLKFIIKPY